MSGFISVDCMTGPALIRLDRIVLVRPDPNGAARTLLVVDGGHELIVMRPAEEMVQRLSAPD